jgi:hypothetical protein
MSAWARSGAAFFLSSALALGCGQRQGQDFGLPDGAAGLAGAGGSGGAATDAAVCPPPTIDCDGICTDTATDPHNCGSCANPCASGQSCGLGECVPGCPAGTTRCGGACIDLLLDPQHCGTCGAACGPGQACAGGACSCAIGYSICGGECVDTLADPAHCGSCKLACSSSEICAQGACKCAGSATQCGSLCIDVQKDASHCGACYTPCDFGQACEAGKCKCAGTTDTPCNGVCTDLETDANHCGGCGAQCGPGQTCSSGKCVCMSSALTACGDGCFDLSKSVDHCGKCFAKCDNGNACTVDVCDAGTCGAGPSPTLYFSEGFADNSAGWTLGNEWQIGSAKASYGAEYGNEDPALDHTPTSDNGVAGVVLGGFAKEVVHDYYYLTSPVIDLSSVSGPVVLGYLRWLNSDYTPYMHNVVQVYDGNAWQTAWQSQAMPGVQDASWTPVSHDLTPYKNAKLRVRFGFKIGNPDVFTVSSWNLDDITIASAACP